MIHVYEATVFTPSRSAATHGCYAKSFLATHHLIEANVVLRLGRRSPSRPGQVKSIVEKGRFNYVSLVYRLLHDNDFSMLPSSASSVSWSSLLSAVADVCAQELFKTRVLSRDVYKLSDDLTDVFDLICDAMDRRAHLDRIARTANTNLRALETAAVFPLLPLLDALTETDTLSNDRTVDMIREVAKIISRKFKDPVQVEENYFTLPATPAWVSAEFGEPGQLEANVDGQQEFTELFQMLKASPGPLRGDKLRDFKRRVTAMPLVLALVILDPNVELCTLLHQAAAGPSHDLYLTEWLIQMGALDMELMCYRTPAGFEQAVAKLGTAWTPNAFAVHCAAKNGYTKIVEFMITAGNYRDIDTRTLRSKESLVQIAVQKGEKELWAWLTLRYDAVNAGVDAAGKRIWAFTSDRKWRSELKQIVAMEKQNEAPNAKDDYNKRMSEKLEKARQRRRDELQALLLTDPTEQSSSRALGRSGSAISSEHTLASARGPQAGKKKSNKTKIKTKQVAAASPPEVRLMDQLFIDDKTSDCKDRVQILSVALEQLKNDTFVSTSERDARADTVLTTFDHFSKSVHDIVMAGLLSKSAAVKREVEAAGRAAIKLHTFQQHWFPSEMDAESPTAMLHARLTPADDERFYLFFELVLKTSMLATYCDLEQLAQQLDDTLVRCLMSITDRSHGFRQMASEYLMRRNTQAMRQTPVNAEVKRQFEWYASRHGIEDAWDVYHMDRLYGCHHFARLQVVGHGETFVPEACRTFIEENIPHGRHAVYEANSIVVGAKTKHQLDAIIAVIQSAATQAGADLQHDQRDVDLSSVDIRGFTFSATGIVRSSR